MEIERKFLLLNDDWLDEIDPLLGIPITQGYLNKDKNRTVRIRTCGSWQGYLTIKGITENISRPEYEYQIPYEHAIEMLQMCDGFPISKTRYKITYCDNVWEIDVFHGENKGLILAEIELESEDECFPIPPWIGKEVSHDKKYFNSSLSTYPFTRWIWV